MSETVSKIDITDDKERYRLDLQEYVAEPSCERLQKLHYFYYDYEIVIYDENGDTVDVEGKPIDPAEGEPSEEELEMYDSDPRYYNYYDEDEIENSLEEYQEEQIDERGMEYWKFVEQCLDKFSEEHSDNTLRKYMQARKLVKEREQLKKSMEELRNQPPSIESLKLILDVKKKIDEKEACLRVLQE